MHVGSDVSEDSRFQKAQTKTQTNISGNGYRVVSGEHQSSIKEEFGVMLLREVSSNGVIGVMSRLELLDESISIEGVAAIF